MSRKNDPMSERAKGVPEGFHTVTPYLVIKDAAKAIDFYIQAFGATEFFRLSDATGRVRHAEIRIGNSPLMIADENPDYAMMRSPQSLGGTPLHVFLYVENVDALMERVVAAGAKLLMAAETHADGDRRGGVEDPYGFIWWIATQVEDISREDIMKRYAQQEQHSAD